LKALLFAAMTASVAIGLSTNARATCSVTNVQVLQTGSNAVDISYDLATDAPPATVTAAMSTDGGVTYQPLTAFGALAGAVGTGISSGTGQQITWNSGTTAWTYSSNDRFQVRAEDASPAPSGFSLIASGSFQMGDALGDSGTTSIELPVHTVNVSAFCMAATLVTKSQWDAVYASGTALGYSFDHAGSGKGATHPVQTVSWYDAVKWCNARSEAEGLTPCYYTDPAKTTVLRTGTAPLTNDCVNWMANGYRLPSEAEWEKAARGGAVGMRFPWASGNTIDFTLADYYGYYNVYAYDAATSTGYNPAYKTGTMPYTSPVASFPANGFGLYDMAGNVTEWCWDWLDNYGSGAVSDPVGPSSGTTGRIVRGGGWGINANHARVSFRAGVALTPLSTTNSEGFRVCRRLISSAISGSNGSSADLMFLTLSSGTLNPVFSSSGTSYTTTVPYTTTNLTVTPMLADAAATVTSITGTSGLAVGSSNVVTITVTAANLTTTKTYTIFVTRALNANANLASLDVSAGILSPVFNSNDIRYGVAVPNDVTSFTVTPTLSDSTATVQITGTGAPLVTGTNIINITVTAPDLVTKKTYTVVVTRLPSTNADLVTLGVGVGMLTPGFTSSGTSYSLLVPYNVTMLAVTPVVSDTTATVQVSGTGTPLVVGGTSTVTIQVTAQDTKIVKTYTVTVTRQPSSNADLATLGIGVGMLTPGFTSSGTSYSLLVPYNVTVLAVTPSVSDTTATVQVSGPGTLLVVGRPSTISIQVTAQDSVTVKTYTVLVTRSVGASPAIGPVTVDAADSQAATVSAAVTPNDTDTTVHFDFGRGYSYSSQTADSVVPASGGVTTVTVMLKGLDAHAAYQVRCTGSNLAGAVSGAGTTIRTLPRLDLNHDGIADLIAVSTGAVKSTKTLLVSPKTGRELGAPVAGPTIPAGYAFCGAGDFFGDGKTTLVFFETAKHRVWFWRMTGAHLASKVLGPTISSKYGVAAVADMDGDGQPDLILVTKSSPRAAVWLMNGTKPIGQPVTGPSLPHGFAIVAADDFNGGGKPDYLLWNGTKRESEVLVLNSTLNGTEAIVPGPVIPAGWQLAGADGYLAGTDAPVWVLYNPATRATQFHKAAGKSLGKAYPGPAIPAGYSLLPAK